MEFKEYIEYMEEDDKRNMKLKRENGKEYFEEDTTIKSEISAYNEYFEEDIKTEHKEEIARYDLVNNSCDICQKHYKTKRNLVNHIQSAHKGIKYPCNLCEYKATSQGHRKRHIESVHQKIKHPCNICDYTATDKRFLKKHIESVHEKISKYSLSS